MEVLYDSYRTNDGYLAKQAMLFCSHDMGEKQYAFYRYETLDGQVDYFTEDGKSIRKSAGLMRTPVAYGRIIRFWYATSPCAWIYQNAQRR